MRVRSGARERRREAFRWCVAGWVTGGEGVRSEGRGSVGRGAVSGEAEAVAVDV